MAADRIAQQYRRFAEVEARGHSPLYEALGLGIAGDTALIRMIETLPEDKRQPNLLFAAFRLTHGTPPDYLEFRSRLLANPDPVLAIMRERRTQTTEPHRCAVLLPVLARLQQPLALIEVGAAAGLCLLPDLYGYDYGAGRVGAAEPVFPCEGKGAPIPEAVPRVAWRAGLDLDPVNANHEADIAWLEALIWPEQTDRLRRFREALGVARRHPPRIRKGDLRHDLAPLLAEAPRGPTLVVFHTAVLGYVRSTEERTTFGDLLWEHSAIWVSNEAPLACPEVASRAPRPAPTRGAFLLAVNEQPVAWTDPHGAWIDWFG
jgi:hypothetical protein